MARIVILPNTYTLPFPALSNLRSPSAFVDSLHSPRLPIPATLLHIHLGPSHFTDLSTPPPSLNLSPVTSDSPHWPQPQSSTPPTSSSHDQPLQELSRLADNARWLIMAADTRVVLIHRVLQVYTNGLLTQRGVRV